MLVDKDESIVVCVNSVLLKLLQLRKNASIYNIYKYMSMAKIEKNVAILPAKYEK